ncbi:unnamed protein product [Urochloa humidicola]
MATSSGTRHRPCRRSPRARPRRQHLRHLLICRTPLPFLAPPLAVPLSLTAPLDPCRYYGGTISEFVLGDCHHHRAVPRDQVVATTKCGLASAMMLRAATSPTHTSPTHLQHRREPRPLRRRPPRSGHLSSHTLTSLPASSLSPFFLNSLGGEVHGGEAIAEAGLLELTRGARILYSRLQASCCKKSAVKRSGRLGHWRILGKMSWILHHLRLLECRLMI